MSLVSICGATGTGKTALAERLASEISGIELVSMDAMAVYRGLDIGTAKPSRGEQEAARWHLLDLVEPSEEFSVAMFQRLAKQALREIASRGNRAVLVGGTGLYHRAVVDDLEIPPRYPNLREHLEEEIVNLGSLALYRRLVELDPLAATRMDETNSRRIVRALEVTVGSGRKFSSFGVGLSRYANSEATLIGLRVPRDVLYERLAVRLDEQFDAGFVDEARELLFSCAPLSRTAGQALGYKELFEYLRGERELVDARAEILRRTRRLAKRQESWFERDPRVQWLDARSDDLLKRARGLIERVPTREKMTKWL